MTHTNDIVESLASDIRAMAADLKFNAGVHLLYTGLLLNKYIDIEARRYGSNRTRLDIMHTLIVHGGILKPSDLSKMTFRSKQTVTEIIDGLEKDGLVKRELVGKDRRTRRVIITRKGLDSIKESLPYTLEVSRKSMPSLSQENMQQLITILKQIRKHLLSQIANSRSKER